MPTNARSSSVQACTMQPWPIVTSTPISVASPSRETWMIEPSWKLVRAPMRTGCDVPAHHAAEPDAGLRAELDVADQRRARAPRRRRREARKASAIGKDPGFQGARILPPARRLRSSARGAEQRPGRILTWLYSLLGCGLDAASRTRRVRAALPDPGGPASRPRPAHDPRDRRARGDFARVRGQADARAAPDRLRGQHARRRRRLPPVAPGAARSRPGR